jgi:hypothetical protein
MTRDERFDEDEWARLVALPRHVADALFAVSSHHPAALRREAHAAGMAITHPHERWPAAPLIGAMLASSDGEDALEAAIEREVVEDPATLRADAVARIRGATPLLARLTPAERDGLRHWLLGVAEAEARSAPERTADEPVSERERDELAEIAGILVPEDQPAT